MTEEAKKVDFEAGDLIPGIVVERISLSEEKEYRIKILNFTGVEGYYRSAVDITGGTRVEVCFAGQEGDRIRLVPKSTMKNRQHLAALASDKESDFSPAADLSAGLPAVKDQGTPVLDFRPPSDFSTALLSLLVSWQLISRDQEIELKDKLKGGDWELVGLLKRLDLFTPRELAAIDFGRDLVKREKISWTEFRRAFFAEVSAGICFEDSPIIKGK